MWWSMKLYRPQWPLQYLFQSWAARQAAGRPNAHGGRIRITSVLRREGGRWLIVHHHEGAVPAGVPPITEAPNRG